jgi:hypothetical protein
MRDSREKLELLKKIKERAEIGDMEIGDLVPSNAPIDKKINLARDLMGETLADQVLKNTGVPIPGKGSSKAQIEDFLARLMKESYPEMEPDIQIKSGLLTNKQNPAMGLYYPGKGNIELDADLVKRSPRDAVSTLLHEAGHKYDDKVIEAPYFPEPKSEKVYEEIREKLKINPDYDPIEMARNKFRGHHAYIPGDRPDTMFESGALKAYLRSGRFKSMLPGIVSAGAGAALAGSASDALADTVIPGGVESVGEGSDKMLTPEQEQSVEASRELSSGQPMNQARLRALQRMLGQK